jgi:DNA-binding NarL/FixJ family response regulator
MCFFQYTFSVYLLTVMNTTEKISILIADDHDLVRRGLVLILGLFPEFTIVGDVKDGREAVDSAVELKPTVVIMDLNMPNLNGIEATRIIKKNNPSIKILIVSAYQDDSYVLQVFRGGANGYLLKTSSMDQFRDAIQNILNEHTFYCPHLDKQMLQTVLHSVDHSSLDSIGHLTAREREIIQLIAASKSHQEIANKLHISVRTVDTHHNNILRKLDMHDTVSLVTFAIKNGLVVLSK